MPTSITQTGRITPRHVIDVLAVANNFQIGRPKGTLPQWGKVSLRQLIQFTGGAVHPGLISLDGAVSYLSAVGESVLTQIFEWGGKGLTEKGKPWFWTQSSTLPLHRTMNEEFSKHGVPGRST